MYSQSCGHLGALLFKVEDIIACGKSKLPADPTCTDLPSYWADPKGAKVDPKKLSDINVGGKQEQPKLRRTPEEYGQLILGAQTGKSSPTPEQIMTLRQSLFSATLGLGVYVPAVHVLNPARFRSETLPYVPPIPDLPAKCGLLAPEIAPAREIEVQSKPLPVAQLPTTSICSSETTLEEKKQEILQMLALGPSQREMIDTITVGQSENIEWYYQRMGSITGSKAWDIVKYNAGNKKISLERLVRNVMGYTYQHLTVPPKPRKPALKWGLAKEHKAKAEYCSRMSSSHVNMRIETHGLIVHSSLPYIRASPDGISHCQCHGKRLLEIKCPYTARDMTPQDAVKAGSIDYLVEGPEGYTLDKSNPNHSRRLSAAGV